MYQSYSNSLDLYKNYKIKIIKNDKKITTESDSDSDYEYLYDDELQILDESEQLLFNLKGYEFKSYENVDNYLILDIDEGNKFSEKILIINLDTFEKHYQIFHYNNRYYFINFNKENKNIIFDHTKEFDIKYFFQNKLKIIEDYESENLLPSSPGTDNGEVHHLRTPRLAMSLVTKDQNLILIAHAGQVEWVYSYLHAGILLSARKESD